MMLGFIPLQRMWARAEQDKEESDYAYATSLLYTGEMTVKLIVAGMLAAIRDDKDRHRYSHAHTLLRADGIGDSANVLDKILTGPAAQFLTSQAHHEQRELIQKCSPDTWQYEAVRYFHECCRYVRNDTESMPSRTSILRALHLFAQIRNKTRGHGAPNHELLRTLCAPLQNGLRVIHANFSLFAREWVYLYRNLSGKYRVTRLSDSSTHFEYMKRSSHETFSDGVYVYFSSPNFVELAHSDVELTDFFLPNGGFSQKDHEWLSYTTGATLYRDSSPYLMPPGTLPESETGGGTELQTLGKCLTNIPHAPSDFIPRHELEAELRTLLMDERHEIVTLIGRGGNRQD